MTSFVNAPILAQDSPGPGSRPVTASGVVPSTTLGEEEEGKYYLTYKELLKHVEFLKVPYNTSKPRT